MDPKIWTMLESEFVRHPVLKGDPVGETEIAGVENAMKARLPGDFREFVARFGCAIVGSERIYGLRLCAAMGKRAPTVLEATDRFRKQRVAGTERWIVFSEDGEGNPIGFDTAGRVMMFEHDSGERVELAPSFEAFLARLLNP